MALREDLLAGAKAVEIETQGFLPASGFVKLIDKGLLPAMGRDDALDDIFLPIVMSVDSTNRPVELPDETTATPVGAVACLSDRAVFAWMTGFVRIKVHNHTLRYSDVTDVSGITYGEIRGLDITEGQRTWTMMFGEQLRDQLVEEYVGVLAGHLRAKAGIAEPAPRTGNDVNQ